MPYTLATLTGIKQPEITANRQGRFRQAQASTVPVINGDKELAVETGGPSKGTT